jgi:hypothetical protein
MRHHLRITGRRLLGLAIGMVCAALLLSGGVATASLVAPDVIQVRAASSWFFVDQEFAVYGKAISQATGKVDKSYSGPAQLSDTSGQAIVTRNDGFTNGEFYGVVKLPVAYHHDTLTLTPAGPVAAANTASFNIEGPLDHITVAYPGSPKTAGVPFDLVLTAYDSVGNVLTRFGAPVSLDDGSHTIVSTESGTTTAPPHWDMGRETIQVAVSSPFVHDRVSVTPVMPSPVSSFLSGVFNVVAGSVPG